MRFEKCRSFHILLEFNTHVFVCQHLWLTCLFKHNLVNLHKKNTVISSQLESVVSWKNKTAAQMAKLNRKKASFAKDI